MKQIDTNKAGQAINLCVVYRCDLNALRHVLVNSRGGHLHVIFAREALPDDLVMPYKPFPLVMPV